MALRDSVDKIVTSYFAAVTAETFVYAGKTYAPRPLHLSENVVIGYTCPPGCGGCCPRFTLDYLPQEKRPRRMGKRIVRFNGHDVALFSDMQDDHEAYHCRNLTQDGRCGIHQHNPFSCDFELLRFAQRANHTIANVQLFGRGWNMLRVDGKRGALCNIYPRDEHTVAQSRRKFVRLEEWAKHFKLKTRVSAILDYIDTRGYERGTKVVP